MKNKYYGKIDEKKQHLFWNKAILPPSQRDCSAFCSCLSQNTCLIKIFKSCILFCLVKLVGPD